MADTGFVVEYCGQKKAAFLAAIIMLIFSPKFGLAQSTATVTDSDSISWVGGTYQITLVPVPPNVTPYRSDTGQNITTSFSGTLDGSGSFSVTLTPISVILPKGLTWQFTVCPNVLAGSCGTVNIPVNGSGSVSSQINAVITAPRISGGRGSYAYADVEVAAVANNSYYNVTSAALRCYGVSWAGCGGGGSGTVTAVTATSPVTSTGGTAPVIACTTCGVTSSPLSQFATTSSAQLASILSDESGTGAVVFASGATINPKQVGSTFYADQFSGSGTAEKINACIAAALVYPQGRCDATAFNGNQIIDQQINVGTTALPPVTLLLPTFANWFSTITTSTSCEMRLFGGATVFGYSPGGAGTTFYLDTNSSGTSEDSALCIDPTATYNYVYVAGLGARNTNGGTFATALFNIQALGDEARFERVFGQWNTNNAGKVWYIHGNVCCGATFDNIQGYASLGSPGSSTGYAGGGTPLTVGDGTNSVTAITISNSTFNAPGTGLSNIVVAAATANVMFSGDYAEGNGAADTTTAMATVASGAFGVNFIGGGFNHFCASSCTGKYAVSNLGTSPLTIQSVFQGNGSLVNFNGSTVAGTQSQMSGSYTNTSFTSIPAISSPQVTVETSGTSQTYTTPTGAKFLQVEMCGPGGGGAGSGTSPGAGGAGSAATTFSTFSAGAGGGATTVTGGTGGAASGGDINVAGSGGTVASGFTFTPGSDGGASFFGGRGIGGFSAGAAAATNSCSGGGGAGDAGTASNAGGGGAGGYVRKLVTSPAGTYTYTVGTGGAGGTAGGTGSAGGNGAAGIIIVTAYFQGTS